MSLKRTVTYVDNRGQEHNVRHMDTSHILNVLNLIRNQMLSLSFFRVETAVTERLINENAHACLAKSLRSDAKVLCRELNRRYKQVGCKGLKETA